MLIFLGPQSACTLSANENVCGCLYQHFQAADICAPYGKCAPPANAPHHHQPFWVESVRQCVLYTPRSLCFRHIFCVFWGTVWSRTGRHNVCKWWFWEGGRDNRKAVTLRLTHRVPSSSGPFEEKVRVTDGVDQQKIRDWSKSFWHSKGCRKASL